MNEEDAMLYNSTHPQFLIELKKVEERYKDEIELYTIWNKVCFLFKIDFFKFLV